MLIDIFRRVPDDNTTTLISLEKNSGTAQGSQRGQELIRNEVLPPLEKLMQDDDVDVRFFASTAAKGSGLEGVGDAMET